MLPDVVDDCHTRPCKNNGFCVDGHDDYTCFCRLGWRGKNCTGIYNTTGWERLIRSHLSERFCFRIKWKFELTVHFKHGMLEKMIEIYFTVTLN